MMRSDPHAAVKCFDENRQLFSDPSTKPEQFNLYTGLAAMAESLAQLQAQIQVLTQEVQQLTYLVKTINR